MLSCIIYTVFKVDKFQEFINNYGIFIAIIVVIVVFVIVFIMVTVSSNRRYANLESETYTSITTPRIFALNLKENRVIFFNRGSYNKQRQGTLELFYQQFSAREIDRLQQWIHSILTTDSYENYFMVDVFVTSLRRTFNSILILKGVDLTKKIIHLESYLFHNILPRKQVNQRIAKKQRIGEANQAHLEKMFKKYGMRGFGFFGAISIAVLKSKKDYHFEAEPHFLFVLKDLAAEYKSKVRFISHHATNQVGIYFVRELDTIEVHKVMLAIKKQLEAFFELNGINEYSVAYAISEAKEFNDFATFARTTFELSDIAHRRVEKMIIYNPRDKSRDFNLTYFRNEITKIIENDKIAVNFQPFVDAQTSEVFGYVASYTVNHTLFRTFDELRDYALVTNLDRQLYKKSLEMTLATFHSYRRNAKQHLFIAFPLHEDVAAIKVYEQSRYANQINVVFTIGEEEVAKLHKNSDEEIGLILKTISRKTPLALIIHDTELTLPNELYAHFKYFIVDHKILNKTLKDERERLYLLASLGKLMRYNVPIIFHELAKWSEIEYYIRAGADYVSSNEISRADPRLLSLDKRKAMRIINFSKRKG